MVLAHELAHLQRRDALLVSALLIAPMALLAAAVAAATGDAAVASRLARLGELAPVVPPLLLIVSSPLLGMHLVIRPRLEWAPDSGAVGLVGDRRALVGALEHGPGRDLLVARLKRLEGLLDRG